jgi:integrase
MKRRGNNEGSIYQRKDGLWAGSISLESGKRKVVYGKTRKEVSQKLAQVQRAIADGQPLGKDRITVRQWLDTWVNENVANRVRPKTLHRYKEIVNLHLIPRLGHIRLNKLTPTDVERARNEALASGQSPRSVNHHRAVLRAALNVAIRHGLLVRNVAELADGVSVPEPERDGVTADRAKAILEAVRGDRLEGLYNLLLASGLRLGEALGLRWSDLDFEDRTLKVQRTLTRLDGEWIFCEPKTRHSRRTVPLPPPVVKALRSHRDLQLIERLHAGPAWIGAQYGELVFTTVLGGPLSEGYVHHHFQKLLGNAGLPKMRVHDLRHAAASMWAALGIPLSFAMSILGHSQMTTTLQVYSHSTDEWERQAMDRAANSLWSPTA